MTSPAGTYWTAVVLESFTLAVGPSLQFRQSPDASVNLTVAPTIEMRPPSAMALLLAPMVIMSGGTRESGAFTVEVAPQIDWFPSAALSLGVSPSFSARATAVSRGGQVNVAVQRSSTF